MYTTAKTTITVEDTAVAADATTTTTKKFVGKRLRRAHVSAYIYTCILYEPDEALVEECGSVV